MLAVQDLKFFSWWRRFSPRHWKPFRIKCKSPAKTPISVECLTWESYVFFCFLFFSLWILHSNTITCSIWIWLYNYMTFTCGWMFMHLHTDIQCFQPQYLSSLILIIVRNAWHIYYLIWKTKQNKKWHDTKISSEYGAIYVNPCSIALA